jgi:long-chain-fatty-acid---luciferin-component ligase
VDGTPAFTQYIQSFNQCLQKYIVPEPWTPAEEALIRPDNLFAVPSGEADTMRLRAIRHAFQHHYDNNPFYRNFCRDSKMAPEMLAGMDDLARIPLIPDTFFKDYPDGADFARWIASLYTGQLPPVTITKREPSYDDVISALNEAGMHIAYSSGTSGRHTFIPRDQRTFYASEYAIAKSVISMIYPFWQHDMDGYLMMPSPLKTNVYAGKVCTMYFDAIENVEVAIDRDLPADLIQQAMQDGIKSRLIRFAIRRENKKMVDRIIRWLRQREQSDRKITMVGLPFILHFVMERLEQTGETFDFGEQGAIATGGGWKIYENSRMPVEDFRRRVEELLGIPSHRCLDVYGMVEGNGWMVHCPEGHYFHVPHSYFHPLILDETYEPVGPGEWGRFAFLDPLATSYPGFIMTGDRVRLLEHCPVCERPGPVLEPEIQRIEGAEMRGCAEEMRRVLAVDLGG